MKRNITAALLAIVVLALVSLILPVSLAKRGKGAPGKTGVREATSGTAKNTLRAANSLLPPQDQSAPIFKRNVSFAESIPLRDMGPVSKRSLTEEEREERESGEKNRKDIRHIDTTVTPDRDGALQEYVPKNAPNAPNVPLVLPLPSLVFDGNSNQDNANLFGFRLSPPDTEGDVGPGHYVQVINLTIRIFDKAGTPLIPAKKFSDIFTALGPPCGAEDGGDPIALYDPLADRWLLSQFCFPFGDPGPYFETIAISKTGDPTGAYYLYNFGVSSAPDNEFPDYPHLGVWPDGYYMSTNQFSQGVTFDGGGVFAFDRQKMLVGDPTAGFIYFNRNLATFPEGQAGFLPADMDGIVPPPAGTACPFAYFTANEFGDPADGMRIFDFHADFAVPANSTFIERPESSAIPGGGIPVAAFNPLSPAGRDDVPQPPPSNPTTARLDAISDRLMHRLQYINFGTHESLVVTNTVNVGADQTLANYRAGIRYYQFRKNPGVNPYAPFEQGTWAGPLADTTHRWMGSAAMNAAGDLAVGYSASSLTTFPSIRYAARFAADPPGGLAQGEQEMFTGTGVQTDTGSRWGDYSALSLDPSDDCTFWHTNETYTAASQATSGVGWITKIGKFNLGSPCTPFPRGTINGTITNCQTGLPIPNAFVSASGYSRGTDAAGTYSMAVTPGTYTVSATATGYDTASTSGVVIANGGSATFNACLSGNLKQPVADGATVTADSCNSNGFIDPNETVTVSLGVKNTGTLNTVNLVGTLQASGGVTSPSGPQNYGVVVAGGATVSRSFTFTAGNLACGVPLVISLQLQDGATNLGTVTYNFTTGTIASSNYSTGDIAVAIPDNTTIDIPLTVADVMTLSDVNVSIRLNHTFDSDLRISLVHPDSTVIPLVLERGSGGDNFGTGANTCAGTGTIIDDQAATLISAGSAPFSGSFRPETALSGLNGKPSNGTWNLRVQDIATQDTGTVGCVKLELNKRNVCCGALINAVPPPVITAESISPANNAADPEETVTVNLSLINNGGSPTTNLVATLQPTGGVAGPSGPQNYGVLASSGGTATRPFTFTAQGTCGSTITLTLALQNGATNLGTVTFTMTLGALVTTTNFSENFDGVTAPALPAGWATAFSGVEVAWVTSATTPSSAPNDAFAPDVSNVGNTTLDTPTINVPAGGGQLTFRNLYNMEAAASPTGAGFDGMVLEISINGGAFNDITTGGNAFIAGGYNRTISPSFASPIAGRLAWSALSGGTTAAPTYITSTINLPAAANGQPIKLRWRAATDNSAVATGAAGVRVDTIVISGSSFVCNSQSCTITAPTSMTIPPGTCGTIVNYSPAVSFTGACGVVQGPTPPSGSFFGIGTTTVFVRGTRADASFTDASFPVTVQESETQATGLGANVTNNYCNTKVTYTAVTAAGSTTVVDAPQQNLPPPYVHCTGCPELQITTTAGFTAPVTTCITMPTSTDFNTFTRLRILHGEPGLVNRTINSNFGNRTICARTATVSPFVVALDPNAPTATGASISGRVAKPDGSPLAGVTMKLTGASTGKVITDANGNYNFTGVATENFYTVTPVLVNYHFGPGSRSFSLLANQTDAGFAAMPDSVVSGNAIDTPDYFVRQHYLDFLGREPDESGFNFWSDQIISCGGEAGCIERRTINVSAAYFLSIEFHETGGLVDSMYRASYDRRPQYAEFMPDTAAVARNVIVGEAGWSATLAANKQAFVNAWVARPAFRAVYDGLSNGAYVDALLAHASGFNGDRAELVNGLSSGAMTRATVLRQIAENDGFTSAKRNEVFVMMEYFGYLRRDPDEAGYNFWLNKLNQHNGNFEEAEMVKSFIVSGEYRDRFRF